MVLYGIKIIYIYYMVLKLYIYICICIKYIGFKIQDVENNWKQWKNWKNTGKNGKQWKKLKKTRSRQLEAWLVQWQSLWGYAGEQEYLNGEMSHTWISPFKIAKLTGDQKTKKQNCEEDCLVLTQKMFCLGFSLVFLIKSQKQKTTLFFLHKCYQSIPQKTNISRFCLVFGFETT